MEKKGRKKLQFIQIRILPLKLIYIAGIYIYMYRQCC